MSIRPAEANEFSGVTPMSEANGAAELENSFSVIDRHSNFDGTFHANRDLRIEGEVKGTIECEGTLFVAQGANVSARVEAENITVAGDLNGDVRCRGRLQIMPSGRVRGKVTTETLVINEGAFYEGQIEMAASGERSASTVPRPLPPKAAPSSPTAIQAPATSQATSATSNVASAESPASSASTFIRRLGGPETPWDSGSSSEPDEQQPPKES
jgi:cytoskeletal protein CcmA (bactofilin family)